MFAQLSPLLLAHLAAAVLALPLGLFQVIAKQGTPSHALAGRIYVPAMLIANLSALATFAPGDPRSTAMLPFHVLAFVSLYSLASGMFALRRWLRHRKQADLKTHKVQMAYSWLGLLMAGISQYLVNDRWGVAPSFSRVQFWTAFTALNLALYVVGSWWIFGRLLKRQDPGT